jgi:DNA-binding protein H-NS
MAVNLKMLNHKQFDDLIQKAIKRQRVVRKQRVDKLREKIRLLIAVEELTFEDVFPTKGKRNQTKSIVAAKYRHPDDAAQTSSRRAKRTG